MLIDIALTAKAEQLASTETPLMSSCFFINLFCIMQKFLGNDENNSCHFSADILSALRHFLFLSKLGTFLEPCAQKNVVK